MILDKILSLGKKERMVSGEMRLHIELLSRACDTFRSALGELDPNLIKEVEDLEREGDAVKRGIISHIYEGAFLPYLRPDLCRFVEIVDEIFDLLKDTVSYLRHIDIPSELKAECLRVATLNFRMAEMLLLTFDAMFKGDDLREKILAIRIYEKKIDDIKFCLIGDARNIKVSDFWSGKMLWDFISGLTTVSDIIEDASDHLLIINVSMR
ncbi:MAG: TIGR00153 family protein [Syntrophobacteraceae bacterium]